MKWLLWEGETRMGGLGGVLLDAGWALRKGFGSTNPYVTLFE